MARPAVLPLLAFAACAVIWGSTWLVIKVGYAEVGPFTAVSLRFLVASVVLLVIGIALRVPLPRTKEEWGVVVWVGLLQFGLDYGLIYWGEQFLTSGLTAILFATLPLFTVLVAHFGLPGDRATPAKLSGVVLGAVGVALLFRESLSEAFDAPVPAMLAILASAVTVAFTTVAAKRWGKSLHPVALTGPAAFLGGVALLPVALLAGEGYSVPLTWTAWGPILYLAVLGSVVTFLLYYWLLKRWSVTNASFISVFTPLVALALGAALLAEPVTPWVLAGAACILGGVVMANRGRAPPANAALAKPLAAKEAPPRP